MPNYSYNPQLHEPIQSSYTTITFCYFAVKRITIDQASTALTHLFAHGINPASSLEKVETRTAEKGL